MSGAKYELGDWVRSKITGVEGVYLRHSDSLGHYIGTGESGEYWCESIEPIGPPPNTMPVRIAVGVDRRGNADAIVIDPQIPQAKVDEIDARHGVRTTIINTYAFLPAAPAEVNATPEVSDEDR